jgi:hypothetical protein
VAAEFVLEPVELPTPVHGPVFDAVWGVGPTGELSGSVVASPESVVPVADAISELSGDVAEDEPGSWDPAVVPDVCSTSELDELGIADDADPVAGPSVDGEGGLDEQPAMRTVRAVAHAKTEPRTLARRGRTAVTEQRPATRRDAAPAVGAARIVAVQSAGGRATPKPTVGCIGAHPPNRLKRTSRTGYRRDDTRADAVVEPFAHNDRFCCHPRGT